MCSTCELLKFIPLKRYLFKIFSTIKDYSTHLRDNVTFQKSSLQ
jgi:hypothetical protein